MEHTNVSPGLAAQATLFVAFALTVESRPKQKKCCSRFFVNLGRNRKYDFFAKIEVLVPGMKKLNTLLPDANVPNMLQREPEILSLDFVRASQRILQMQELLCSADQCYEVTGILERCPRLLLCDDIPSQVVGIRNRLLC